MNYKRSFQRAQTLFGTPGSNTKQRNPVVQQQEEQQRKHIVIVGAGVAGINAATKLVDNGYPGELITIIDKGNDPINRLLKK